MTSLRTTLIFLKAKTTLIQASINRLRMMSKFWCSWFLLLISLGKMSPTRELNVYVGDNVTLFSNTEAHKHKKTSLYNGHFTLIAEWMLTNLSYRNRKYNGRIYMEDQSILMSSVNLNDSGRFVIKYDTKTRGPEVMLNIRELESTQEEQIQKCLYDAEWMKKYLGSRNSEFYYVTIASTVIALIITHGWQPLTCLGFSIFKYCWRQCKKKESVFQLAGKGAAGSMVVELQEERDPLLAKKEAEVEIHETDSQMVQEQASDSTPMQLSEETDFKLAAEQAPDSSPTLLSEEAEQAPDSVPIEEIHSPLPGQQAEGSTLPKLSERIHAMPPREDTADSVPDISETWTKEQLFLWLDSHRELLIEYLSTRLNISVQD